MLEKKLAVDWEFSKVRRTIFCKWVQNKVDTF